MIARRDALALLGGIVATACSGARRASPALPPAPTFGLDPIVDLVPAAGLVWLVEARPRDLFESPALGPALATIATDERVAAFARRFGGIDLHRAGQVAVAGWARSFLGLARVPLDPVAVEAAVRGRGEVDERTVERGVTRLRGTAGGEPQQIALFGQRGAAIQRGQPGPIEAAVYFAEGKLWRARPALGTDPLADAAARIGEAPLRGFAPGPFEGPWGAGLGGLLRASTAAAAAMRPAAGPGGSAVALALVLTGAWGADAAGAEARLGAAFHVLSEDPLGRLTGANQPLVGPRTWSDPGALRLEVVLDPAAIARGLRDATDATVAEIMGMR